MYNVFFYRSGADELPVMDHISSTTCKEQAILLREISLIGIIEDRFRGTYFRYVSDDIFELNVKVGSNLSKVFYFITDTDRVIILNSFTKKTKINPAKLLEEAVDKKDDYFNNKAKRSLSLKKILNNDLLLKKEYKKLSDEYAAIKNLAESEQLNQLDLLDMIQRGVIYITKDEKGYYTPSLKQVKETIQKFGNTIQFRFLEDSFIKI